MILWNCCTQYASKSGKLSSGQRIGKDQFSFQPQRKAMPKNVQTTTQLHSFHILANNAQNPPSWASTVCELSDVQAGFRKGRGTRGQIANICWILEKATEFQKNIYFCSPTMPKTLTVWITINCGKFWKRWEYQTTWSASWEICMQVKKQQLELDMEQ